MSIKFIFLIHGLAVGLVPGFCRISIGFFLKPADFNLDLGLTVGYDKLFCFNVALVKKIVLITKWRKRYLLSFSEGFVSAFNLMIFLG